MQSLLTGLSGGEHVPDARLFAIGLAALGLCILAMGFAAWRHRRNLAAVPVRIHVAGTRGKSTTVRLIAAGLRAGGRRVLAKTTGSEPRLILPDGREDTWPRRGPAAVREQARFLARAVRLGADTVVVECMAIRPDLVWASERHLVQATTAVITNTRADHAEDLGLAPDAAAQAARWCVPAGGELVVAAEATSPQLRAWAATRGSNLTVVDTAGLDPLATDRALAVAVCAHHGVAAEIAGPAMEAALPDPGAFSAQTLTVAGKTLRFANAFACNDVASLALLWPTVAAASAPVVLLNARRDRPLRTKRFLEFVAAQAPAPILYLAGDPLALRLARRTGFAADAARPLRARTPSAALNELAERAPDGGVIWGIGNYHGFGARLVTELAGRSSTC